MPSKISSSGGLVKATLTGINSDQSLSSLNVDLTINNVKDRLSITRFLFLEVNSVIEFMIPNVVTSQNVTAELEIYFAELPSFRAVSNIDVYTSSSASSIFATSQNSNSSSVVVILTNVPHSPSSFFFTITCFDSSVVFQSGVDSSNTDALAINISISVWTSVKPAKFVFTHLPSQASLEFTIPYFIETALTFEKLETDTVICDSSNPIIFKTTGQFISIDAIDISVTPGARMSIQNYAPSSVLSGFVVGSFQTPCNMNLGIYHINLTTSKRRFSFVVYMMPVDQFKISALIPQSGPQNGFSMSIFLSGRCDLSNVSIRVGQRPVIPLFKSQNENQTILTIFTPSADFALPQRVIVQCARFQVTETVKYFEICDYPKFCLNYGLIANQSTFHRQDEACDSDFCIDRASIPSPTIILSTLKNIGAADAWFLVVKDMTAFRSSDIRIICDKNVMSIHSSKFDAGFPTELVISIPSDQPSSQIACLLFSAYYGERIATNFVMNLRSSISSTIAGVSTNTKFQINNQTRSSILSVYPSMMSTEEVLKSVIILRYSGLKEDAYLSYNDINTFIIIPASTNTSSEIETISFSHNISIYNVLSLLSFHQVNATLWSKNLVPLTKPVFAFNIFTPFQPRVISVYPPTIPINVKTAVKFSIANFIPRRIVLSAGSVSIAFSSSASCSETWCDIELQLHATSCTGVSILFFDSLEADSGSKLSHSIRASHPPASSSPSSFHLQSVAILKFTSFCTFSQSSKHLFKAYLGSIPGKVVSVSLNNELCEGCSTIVTASFETNSSNFDDGRFYTLSIVSDDSTDSVSIKTLPSIKLLFNTTVPVIQFVNGMLQHSLQMVLFGLPFSLLNEDSCIQSKISLNSHLIQSAFKSCLSNSITISLRNFDGTLLINSKIAIIHFELNYFGDIYQASASAIVDLRNELQVAIISSSVLTSFSVPNDRELIASLSSSNSSLLSSTLKVRMEQTVLSFNIVFSQGTELIIRILVPAAHNFRRSKIIFTAFLHSISAEVLLEPLIQVHCSAPCFKSFSGGMLSLNLPNRSSLFNELSDFSIMMQNQFLLFFSFSTSTGTISLLIPPIILNTIKDYNSFGQIFATISVQHSKFPNVRYSVLNFYYQSPVKVESGILDSSGCNILVTFNQKVAFVESNLDCKSLFQGNIKLGEGWTCIYHSDSSITISLGTGASIVPGDLLSILASQLRPIRHRDSFFDNLELVFRITSSLIVDQLSVILQGSAVIDPCSSVIITALFDSPRKLLYSWSCLNDDSLNLAISKERNASVLVSADMLESPRKSYIISVSITNFLGFSWSSPPFELLFDASESLKISILPLYKSKFAFTDDIEISSIVEFSNCKSQRSDISYSWSIKDSTATPKLAQELSSASSPSIFLPASLFVPNSPNVLTVTAFGVSTFAQSSVVVWVSSPPLPNAEIFGCVTSASVSQSLKMPIILHSSLSIVRKISLICSTEDSQNCRDSQGIPITFNVPVSNSVLEIAAFTFSKPFIAIFSAEIMLQNTSSTAMAVCKVSFVNGDAIPSLTIKKIEAAQNIDPRLPLLIEAQFDAQKYKCIWEESSGLIRNMSSYADPQIGFERQSLLILGATLMPGIRYQFKVSLLFGSTIVASESTSIRTNTAPTQGSCRIFYNADSTATLSCSKWIDEDLPILYKFGFRSSTSNVSLEYSRIPNFTFFIFGGEMIATVSICDSFFFCSPEIEFFPKGSQATSFALSQDLSDSKKLSSISKILSLGVAFSSSFFQGPLNTSTSRTLLQEATGSSLSSIIDTTAGILQQTTTALSIHKTSSVLSYLNYATRTSKLICGDACLRFAVTALERLVIIGRFEFQQRDLSSIVLDCIGSFLDISSPEIENMGQRISTLSDFFKIAITNAMSESMINEQSPVILGSFDSLKVATYRFSAVPEMGRSFTSTRDSKNRAAMFYLSSIFFRKHLSLNSTIGIIAASLDVQEIPFRRTQSLNNSANVYFLNSLFGLRFSQYPRSPIFSTSILIALDFESDTVPYHQTLWRTKLRVTSWTASSTRNNNDCSVVNVSVSQGKNTLFALCNKFNAVGIEVDPNATLCGNGYLEPSEQCDDGNVLPFDGCDDNCRVEMNWKCFRTGTFKVEDFNPDICLFTEVPYILCPMGYFGSSCSTFILPLRTQRFEISSGFKNSIILHLGESTLKILIPANATRFNTTLTIRVYPMSTFSEKPSSELFESLQFSQFVFVVEPYIAFLSDVQVEIVSSGMFVHSNSNSSKISNILNPSSIVAYQQTESFCVSRSSCQVQIGSLGSKLGGWAPFEIQISNSSSYTVFFRTKVLSKFSFMMKTPIIRSVTPSRDLFNVPSWVFISFVCSALALSVCVGLVLWYRLRAHDTQVLEKLVQKYSVHADEILNSSANINSPRNLTHNLDIKRSSLYVLEESLSEETTSIVSTCQLSDDDDHTSNSLGASEEDQQQHTNGTTLTAETPFLNEDGKIPEAFNWKLIKSAQPTEEELDLNFLMELTPNPQRIDFLDVGADLFSKYHISSVPIVKSSEKIYAEVGAIKTAGSLVFSPRIAKDLNFSEMLSESIKPTPPIKSNSTLRSNLRQSSVVKSGIYAKPLPVSVPNSQRSLASFEFQAQTGTTMDFSKSSNEILPVSTPSAHSHSTIVLSPRHKTLTTSAQKADLESSLNSGEALDLPQTEQLSKGRGALPVLSLTRMAPRLVRHPKRDGNVDIAAFPKSTTQSQTSDDQLVAIIPSTLRSKFNSATVLRTNHSAAKLRNQDPTISDGSVPSTSAATMQPFLSEFELSLRPKGSSMPTGVTEDFSSLNPISPRSIQPSKAGAIQLQLDDIGLSVSHSQASKKAHSSVLTTPRPAASTSSSKSSVSAAQTHFSYKKPDVVRDPHRHR
jgi:cysteine-rich repeat protein